MAQRPPQYRLRLGDVVADAGADAVADEKSGIGAPRRWQYRQRRGHMRAAAVGEHHAVGDLAGQRDHSLAQGRQDHRRPRTGVAVRAVFLDKGAGVGERLSRRHPDAHMRRPVRDPDAELESPSGDFVDIGRGVGELLGSLGIDRRDRGGERDALGRKGEPDALRHVGV